MQRERLVHVEQRRHKPKDQEAERHRQLYNPERPRERDPRRGPAMSTTEANQQRHSRDRQREQHPVRETVRRERGGGQRRVHPTTLATIRMVAAASKPGFSWCLSLTSCTAVPKGKWVPHRLTVPSPDTSCGLLAGTALITQPAVVAGGM